MVFKSGKTKRRLRSDERRRNSLCNSSAHVRILGLFSCFPCTWRRHYDDDDDVSNKVSQVELSTLGSFQIMLIITGRGRRSSPTKIIAKLITHRGRGRGWGKKGRSNAYIFSGSPLNGRVSRTLRMKCMRNHMFLQETTTVVHLSLQFCEL